MNSDLKYWLAISQFSKIGASRFKKLYNYFPTLEAAWKASALELQQSGLEENLAAEFIIVRQQINPEAELEKILDHKIEVILIKDNNYPRLLKEIANPPALLYCQGNLAALNNQFNLAVVGTRKISNYGRQVTPELVRPLAQQGITITSGLALGVDALAHQVTIEAQGQTIAVLGSGIDQQSIYPSSNRQLSRLILANNGVVLSEFPIGTLPLKHNFPTRNRVIAGLSLGTLVIEAASSSGALITALSALESNREVFAVPGPLYNPNSAGTHMLIQRGAKLVTNYQDILDELNWHEVKSYLANQQILPETNEEKIIFNQLSKEPKHIDKIISDCNLPIHTVNSTLSLMELKGLIKNLGGQNYIICA